MKTMRKRTYTVAYTNGVLIAERVRATTPKDAIERAFEEERAAWARRNTFGGDYAGSIDIPWSLVTCYPDDGEFMKAVRGGK